MAMEVMKGMEESRVILSHSSELQVALHYHTLVVRMGP